LLIWRIGGDLFFASIGHYDAELKAALAAAHPPAKHVLLDADSVNFIDTSACDTALNSIRELQSRGITFAVARVRDEVRERLRVTGIEAVLGSENFYERVIRTLQESRFHAPGQRPGKGLMGSSDWGTGTAAYGV
jgi:anti-anti-sigma factor